MLRRLDRIRFRGHKREDFLDLAESPNASDTECGDELPLKIPRTSPRDSEELRDPVSTTPSVLVVPWCMLGCLPPHSGGQAECDAGRFLQPGLDRHTCGAIPHPLFCSPCFLLHHPPKTPLYRALVLDEAFSVLGFVQWQHFLASAIGFLGWLTNSECKSDVETSPISAGVGLGQGRAHLETPGTWLVCLTPLRCTVPTPGRGLNAYLHAVVSRGAGGATFRRQLSPELLSQACVLGANHTEWALPSRSLCFLGERCIEWGGAHALKSLLYTGPFISGLLCCIHVPSPPASCEWMSPCCGGPLFFSPYPRTRIFLQMPAIIGFPSSFYRECVVIGWQLCLAPGRN
jgi:hypothetical protein